MADFDDLLNFGDTPPNANQSNNPFGSFETGGSTAATGDLLDFDFGAPIPAQNAPSGKISFDANTNPLYELSNNSAFDIMSAEPNNALLDFGAPEEGKGDSAMDLIEDLKMDNKPATNGLVDVNEEADTNGHDEQLVENGQATGEEIENKVEPVDDIEGAGEPELVSKAGEDQIVPQVDESELKADEPVEDQVAEESVEEEKVPEPADDVVEDTVEEPAEQVVEDTVEEPVEEVAKDTVGEPAEEVAEDTVEEPAEQVVEELAEETQEVEAEPEKLDVQDEAPEEVCESLNDKIEEAAEPAEDQAEKDTDTAEPPADLDQDEIAEETTDADKVEEAPPSELAVCPPADVDDAEADKIDEADLKPEDNDQFDNADEAENVQKEAEPEAQAQDDMADVAQENNQDSVDEPKAEPEPQEEPVEKTEQSEAESVKAETLVVEPAEPAAPVPEEPVAVVEQKEETIEPVASEQVESVNEAGDVTEETEVPAESAPEPVEPEVPELEVEAAETPEPEPVAAPEPVPEPEVVEQEPEKPVEEPTPAVEEPVPAVEEPAPAVEEQAPADEPALALDQPSIEITEPEETAESADVPEQVEEQPAEVPAEVPAEPEKEVEDSSNAAAPAAPAVPAAESSSHEPEENAAKFNGNNEVKENGVSDEDAVRDPEIFRETRDKEEVHFAEMNNVRQKFESGVSTDQEPPKKTGNIRDEYDEGGEYESTPVENPDVVKETDQMGEELPEIGTAKSLLNKFKSIQDEKAAEAAAGSQRKPSPPKEIGKVEYTNEPAERQEQYIGKSDEGEFESTPKEHEDVVRSGDRTEDVIPEKGTTKNIMNKFKEIQSGTSPVRSPDVKRELTPDRSGKVEYVSEPRGERIEYEETKGDSGVFESTPTIEEGVVRSEDVGEEVLPQAGTAKSLLSKFKQYETEYGNKPPPSPKREITPDRSGKVEYVSEPRGFLEKYEPQTEAGVYENEPDVKGEVVKCGESKEEFVPEAGTAKKTMERFKEIQQQSSSPVSKPRQSFTPPRELSPGRNVSGVSENEPEVRPDVVKSGESVQEELPEQGTAKNILSKFREIQSGSSSPVSPVRKNKEFTPPPESGVYENKPSESIKVENDYQAFSGVLENTPSKSDADVPVQREPLAPEEELPESGTAKNLLSKFRQLETSANTSKSASPKFKEFTPPRDSRGPLSPKSPVGATTNGVHPSDLPGQYQQQEGATIYENEPEKKEDVFREADTDWSEGLPKANTTSSMLERFRNIQQKAVDDKKTPAPVSRKDGSVKKPVKAKGMFKVVQTEKCAACDKTVYAMEKLEMNGHVYHRNCFKCSHCSARLTPKTFSMNEGVIYCITHFKQLFARKGNYDEGFGRSQYKKKWGEKEGATA